MLRYLGLGTGSVSQETGFEQDPGHGEAATAARPRGGEGRAPVAPPKYPAGGALPKTHFYAISLR